MGKSEATSTLPLSIDTLAPTTSTHLKSLQYQLLYDALGINNYKERFADLNGM